MPTTAPQTAATAVRFFVTPVVRPLPAPTAGALYDPRTW